MGKPARARSVSSCRVQSRPTPRRWGSPSALEGDVQAARELVDRAESRPLQALDVPAEAARPLKEYADEHGLDARS
jgi:hypothetical protein